jgi:predicted RNase H-like HicB family nuclease
MMVHRYTLEYWQDRGCYVGLLLEVPGVFSQGKTLAELQESIQEAYDLIVTEDLRFVTTPQWPQPEIVNNKRNLMWHFWGALGHKVLGPPEGVRIRSERVIL